MWSKSIHWCSLFCFCWSNFRQQNAHPGRWPVECVDYVDIEDIPGISTVYAITMYKPVKRVVAATLKFQKNSQFVNFLCSCNLFCSQEATRTPFPTNWHEKVLEWPWKWGQAHQNLITYFPRTNNFSVPDWSKSPHRFRRQRTHKSWRRRVRHKNNTYPLPCGWGDIIILIKNDITFSSLYYLTV